jgi:putative membrane protein
VHEKIGFRRKWLGYSLGTMSAFVIRWLVTTLAVFVAEKLIPGIDCEGWGSLLGASLLLGIINAFVRPVLLILSIPFIVVTMGLFILVVNSLMLLLVSALMPGFEVSGFWQAFFGSIVISLVSWPLSCLFRASDGRVHVITHHPQIKKAEARVIE